MTTSIIFALLLISGFKTTLGDDDLTDCYNPADNGTSYLGIEDSVKHLGKKIDCQAWASSYPHTHTLLKGQAHNFCRNPNGRLRPWCYTTDKALRWAYCSIPPCKVVNGSFGNWSPWTECNKSCGKGRQFQTRQCDNPSPQNGGVGCTGERTKSRSCNPKPCPKSCAQNKCKLLAGYDFKLSVKNKIEPSKNKFILKNTQLVNGEGMLLKPESYAVMDKEVLTVTEGMTLDRHWSVWVQFKRQTPEHQYAPLLEVHNCNDPTKFSFRFYIDGGSLVARLEGYRWVIYERTQYESQLESNKPTTVFLTFDGNSFTFYINGELTKGRSVHRDVKDNKKTARNNDCLTLGVLSLSKKPQYMEGYIGCAGLAAAQLTQEQVDEVTRHFCE